MPKKQFPPTPHLIKWSSKVVYEVVKIKDFKDGNTLGECRSEPPQIVLKEDQTAKAEFSCLIHEIFHLISFETDAKLTEDQVLKLEKGAMRLFKQNGWI
jgi:hypothetical protein